MDAPAFFVPGVPADEQEETYAALAALCPAPTPPRDSRIFSITFSHDGEVWTATVGESLRGERPSQPATRRKKATPRRLLTDPGVVLAIYGGYPYFVVLRPTLGSKWANPFMVAQPTSEVLFR